MKTTAIRIKNRFIYVPVILLTLTAFSITAAYSANNPPKRLKAMNFIVKGFKKPFISFGVEVHITAEELQNRLGEPVTTKSRTEKDNQEARVAHNYLTLVYEGLSITVQRVSYKNKKDNEYVFPEGDKYSFPEITLTGRDHPLIYGLGIGIPRKMFLEQLGEPRKEKSGRIEYIAETYRKCGFLTGTIIVAIDFDDKDNAKKIRWRHDLSH